MTPGPGGGTPETTIIRVQARRPVDSVAAMNRGIRVTVRGAFDSLSAGQRAELLASAAEHDFLNTSYTPEGYLAYYRAARPYYTFR